MSYNLVLNSTNLVNGSSGICNNYTYNFINGSLDVPEGSEISLSALTIPYSWYNITSQIGNNTFTYYIPNSSNVQTAYTVTLANGFYTITDINNALQAVMKTNGHYWYSELGAYSAQFQFSGTTSGTTLTVSSASSASVQLIIGTSISGYGVTAGTIITAQTGPYTYTMNNSFTISTQTPLLCSQGNEIIPTIIYPLSIQTYTPYYTNSIISYTIPTAANIQNIFGSGFYNANGYNGQSTWAGGYPTSGNQCAYIVFPTTSSTTTTIGNLIGFTSTGLNSYPVTTSSISSSVQTQTVYGNSLSASPPFSPLGSTVNGVVVRCNLVENNITMPSDLMDNFCINSTFGSNINYFPIADNWVKMKTGRFRNMTISLCDQNFNPLQAQDPNVLISVLIKIRR